jgi:hypothetical protein
MISKARRIVSRFASDGMLPPCRAATLLLRGLPTGHIAQTLFISRHTLSDHMKAIFAKTGVSSRPELTALLLGQSTTGNT